MHFRAKHWYKFNRFFSLYQKHCNRKHISYFCLGVLISLANLSNSLLYLSSISAFLLKMSWNSLTMPVCTSNRLSKLFSCSFNWTRISERKKKKIWKKSCTLLLIYYGQSMHYNFHLILGSLLLSLVLRISRDTWLASVFIDSGHTKHLNRTTKTNLDASLTWNNTTQLKQNDRQDSRKATTMRRQTPV